MLNYYIYDYKNEMISWGQVRRTLYLDQLEAICDELVADASKGYIAYPNKMLLTQAATTDEPPLTGVYKYVDGWRYAGKL